MKTASELLVAKIDELLAMAPPWMDREGSTAGIYMRLADWRTIRGNLETPEDRGEVTG